MLARRVAPYRSVRGTPGPGGCSLAAWLKGGARAARARRLLLGRHAEGRAPGRGAPRGAGERHAGGRARAGAAYGRGRAGGGAALRLRTVCTRLSSRVVARAPAGVRRVDRGL